MLKFENGGSGLVVVIMLVAQKPRPLGGHGHVARNEQTVMTWAMAKLAHLSAVGRECLVFQLLKVDIFRLVDVHEVERF